MKYFVIALVMLFISCQPEKQETSSEYWMYVSSNEESDSTGVVIYKWDPASETITEEGRDHTISKSSYLTIDTTSNVLYAVSETAIQSFRIDRKTGQLQPMNQVSTGGDEGCYISVAGTDNRFVMVAYYGAAKIESYSLNSDGSIHELLTQIHHEGTGPHPVSQLQAHPHMIFPVPESNLVLVPDLGIDEVKIYEPDTKGTLTPAANSSIEIEAGAGPRHLDFHPNLKWLYVVHELNNKVTALEFDRETGAYEIIGVYSTLPADFSGESYCADIHVSPDGKYLYASNRGDNSIAIFKIDPDSGALEFDGTESCGGNWPRAFAFDPTGNFMMVTNQRSDNLSLMKMDLSTGHFSQISEMKTPGSPQCIRFIKAE